ncbi:MAG: hypothetical protein HXY47_01910 [Nitrospirae bacterium]|nr:hypothetical protein [Nitrospirota bacterium]
MPATINRVPKTFNKVTVSPKNLFETSSITGKVILIAGYAKESLTFVRILNHIIILLETTNKCNIASPIKR